MGSKHVCQKLQTLLNIHSEKTSSNEKSNLEKSNLYSIIQILKVLSINLDSYSWQIHLLFLQ